MRTDRLPLAAVIASREKPMQGKTGTPAIPPSSRSPSNVARQREKKANSLLDHRVHYDLQPSHAANLFGNILDFQDLRNGLITGRLAIGGSLNFFHKLLGAFLTRFASFQFAFDNVDQSDLGRDAFLSQLFEE